MRHWILFDDGGGRFGPLTDLRPFADLRTAACTPGERLALRLGAPRATIVPEPMRELARERGVPGIDAACEGDRIEVWSARLRSVEDLLAEPPEPGSAWVSAKGDLLAASVDAAAATTLASSGSLPAAVRRVERNDLRQHERPWDLLDDLDASLRRDLEAKFAALAASGEKSLEVAGIVVGDAPVFVHSTASIGRGVVLDATGGPILIEAGAKIGHAAILIGPLWIGAGSVVIDRAHLKASTAIGPVCKVGGEIGSTVFQGHANKTHDGHLGDAWVGEWANFGAATVNSNLLNTYGEVSMRIAPDGPSERTGRSAMGCLVGDHVKFAIGTRITTGSCFGTGSMVAVADPPRSVGRFRWLTDRGEAHYRLDRFLEVAQTVTARRGVRLGAAALARIASLHAEASQG